MEDDGPPHPPAPDGASAAASSAAPPPTPMRDWREVQPSVHLAVELDRQTLRADFSVDGRELPVMIPLAELSQRMVGVWVEPGGATAVRLMFELRNGDAFRVMAVGGDLQRLPQLRMDSVDRSAPWES